MYAVAEIAHSTVELTQEVQDQVYNLQNVHYVL